MAVPKQSHIQRIIKGVESDPKNPLVEPPLRDVAKCDEFFARCDAICVMESQTQNIHDIYKISFASWAGVQVIQSIQLAVMPERHDIVVDGCKLAADEYMRQNPELKKSLQSTHQLPSHVQFPPSTEHAVNTGCDIGPHLIGTTIRYLDEGKTIECTIQDYGTSELRGDWVEVIYGDDVDEREMCISQKEMSEMLANCISADGGTLPRL